MDPNKDTRSIKDRINQLKHPTLDAQQFANNTTANSSSNTTSLNSTTTTTTTTNPTQSTPQKVLKPSAQNNSLTSHSIGANSGKTDGQIINNGMKNTNLVSAASVSANHARGVFVRPHSNTPYPFPTTTPGGNINPTTTYTNQNQHFNKTISTDGYFFSHSRQTLSIAPLSLTNEPTKLITDDNFHLNQPDKPTNIGALRFGLQNYDNQDQDFQKKLSSSTTTTTTASSPNHKSPINEWSTLQLLQRPIRPLTQGDLDSLPSNNSLINNTHVKLMSQWLTQSNHNINTNTNTTMTHVHIVSLVPTMQLECISSLRFIPCYTNNQCNCTLASTQRVQLPSSLQQPTSKVQNDINLENLFGIFVTSSEKNEKNDQNNKPLLSNLSTSNNLISITTPEYSLVDLTDHTFITTCLSPDAKPLPMATNTTTGNNTKKRHILDLIPLSSSFNSIVVSTDTSTTHIIKMIQGIPLSILTIDPLLNPMQNKAMANILQFYTAEASISSMFPLSNQSNTTNNGTNNNNNMALAQSLADSISDHHQQQQQPQSNNQLKSNNNFITTPRGTLLVTSVSSDPLSKHQMVAISYALYPVGTINGATTASLPAPLFQCIILFSGLTLLPLLPIAYNQHQHPVLLLDYETMVNNSTPETSQKVSTSNIASTFNPMNHPNGMPFNEQIVNIQLSKTGLHILITTTNNHIYVHSLFTSQWIRYIGDTTSLLSNTTNTGAGTGIFPCSSLILKDTIRLVTSDSLFGSEYKIDPHGLYDHVPYILTLLPHGRKDIATQNEKLLDAITTFTNTTNNNNNTPTTQPNIEQQQSQQQIDMYKRQLDVINQSQVRITGINTNIRFVLFNTDKNKNRSVTLMSFDTHSLLPHITDDTNNANAVQNNTQELRTTTATTSVVNNNNNSTKDTFSTMFGPTTKSTVSNRGIYGGVITYGNNIESFYSFSTLQLPRVELINARRSIMLFDHIRKILIIASASGDKELYFIEVHKNFFSELNLQQIESKTHKEAARRASILSPIGTNNNKNQSLNHNNNGIQDKHQGELSNILPYITTYKPYTLSLHFLNKHTLVHPIIDMTLRYTVHSGAQMGSTVVSTWPYLLTLRKQTTTSSSTSTNQPINSFTSAAAVTGRGNPTGQDGNDFCVEMLELKRRAGVLSHSHRDSIFISNATKHVTNGALGNEDGNINYSKSGRNKQFEMRKMTRFTQGFSSLNNTFASMAASSTASTAQIAKKMNSAGVFLINNIMSFSSQFHHCDCGNSDIVIQYQKRINTTKEKLQLSSLTQDAIAEHLAMQQQQEQQRTRHDSLYAQTSIPLTSFQTSTTTLPGVPEVAIVEDISAISTPRATKLIAQPTPTLQQPQTITKQPQPVSQVIQVSQPIAKIIEEDPDNDTSDSDDEKQPYSISYYDDYRFQPPPPQQFSVTKDAPDMLKNPFQYKEGDRTIQLSKSDLELSHLNIQHGLNQAFPHYDVMLSDEQIVELIYKDQVLDLQTQLGTTYIELDVMHEANTLLKNENTFLRHENRLLQQQRDMLLDILKLRLEDLYMNNAYSNAYQIGQHESQLNGTNAQHVLQWDYSQSYIDFYNHYNLPYMMGKGNYNQNNNNTIIANGSSTPNINNNNINYNSNNISTTLSMDGSTHDDDHTSTDSKVKSKIGGFFGKLASKADKDGQSTPVQVANNTNSNKKMNLTIVTNNQDADSSSNSGLVTPISPLNNINSRSPEQLSHNSENTNQCIGLNTRNIVLAEQEQTYYDKQSKHEQRMLKTSQRARIVGHAPTLNTLFDDDDDVECTLTHNPLQSSNPTSRQVYTSKNNLNTAGDSNNPLSPNSARAQLNNTAGKFATSPGVTRSGNQITTVTSPSSADIQNTSPTQNVSAINNNNNDNNKTGDNNKNTGSSSGDATTPQKPKLILLKDRNKLTNQSSNEDNPPPPPPDDEADEDEMRDSITGLGNNNNNNTPTQPYVLRPNPNGTRQARQSILDKAKYANAQLKDEKCENNKTAFVEKVVDNSNNNATIVPLDPNLMSNNNQNQDINMITLSTPQHNNDNDVYVSFFVSKMGQQHLRMKTRDEKNVTNDPLCDPETKLMVFSQILNDEKEKAAQYADDCLELGQYCHQLLHNDPDYNNNNNINYHDNDNQTLQLLVKQQQSTLTELQKNQPNTNSAVASQQQQQNNQNTPTLFVTPIHIDDSTDIVIPAGHGDDYNNQLDPQQLNQLDYDRYQRIFTSQYCHKQLQKNSNSLTQAKTQGSENSNYHNQHDHYELGNLYSNQLTQHLHDTFHAYTFAEIEAMIDVYQKQCENEMNRRNGDNNRRKAQNVVYSSNPLFQQYNDDNNINNDNDKNNDVNVNNNNKNDQNNNQNKPKFPTPSGFARQSIMSMKRHNSLFASNSRFREPSHAMAMLQQQRTSNYHGPNNNNDDKDENISLFDMLHSQLSTQQHEKNNYKK